MPDQATLHLQIAHTVYHFQIHHDEVSVARQPTDPHFAFTPADNRYVARAYHAPTQVWDHAALNGLAACYEYRRELESHASALNNLTVGAAIHHALRTMTATQTTQQEAHRILTATNDENELVYLEYDPDDSASPYTLTVHFSPSGLERATQSENMTRLWRHWIGDLSASGTPLDDALLNTLATAVLEEDQAEDTRQLNWAIPPRASLIWTVDWEAWHSETFIHQGTMSIPSEDRQEAEQGIRDMLDQLFPNLYPGAEIVFTSVLAKKDA